MKRLTKTQIDADLLAGEKLTWSDPNGKAADTQLRSVQERRLYQFIRSSPVREAKDLPPEFIEGLWSAYSEGDDPANAAQEEAQNANQRDTAWRIKHLRTRNFGGINAWNGPDFTWNLDAESWRLEGENGSGKSSLLSAIVFAFTGKRPRDDRSHDARLEGSVFDVDQKKLGTWPPLAAYPDSTADLKTKPEVKVVLTLENDAGEIAKVGHGLIDGKLVKHREGLPEFDEVFINTGIVMPVMLSALRLGEGDDALTRAVEQLTGLDTLSAVGELCSGLTYANREYRSYAKKKNLDILIRDFDADVKSATDTLAPIGIKVNKFTIEDAEKNDGPIVALGQEVKQSAAQHADLLKDDLADGLDPSDTATQRKVTLAIGSASEQLALGLSGMATWKLVTGLSDAITTQVGVELDEAVRRAEQAITEALESHRKAQADARYVMKARAAAWHAKHSEASIDKCPLCEHAFEEGSPLKGELEALRTAGQAALRDLASNLLDASSKLIKSVPSAVARFLQGSGERTPCASLLAEINASFGNQSKAADSLRKFADLANDALERAPQTELKARRAQDVEPVSDEHRDILDKISRIHLARDLAQWHLAVEPAWSQWWGTLTAIPSPDSGEAQDAAHVETLSEHLGRLTTSLEKAKPYATAASHLRKAVENARKALEIQTEQKHRDEVSDALQPLKSLVTLSESVARQAIGDLSGKIGQIVDGMHQAESFSFKSAGLDRKLGVQVRGGFGDAISMDANLVANTSWLRSALWAFIFALRQEAVEQHGFDPIPVWLFDDPQSTFDGSHRLGWASYVANLQSATQRAQVVLGTHDESFHNKLKQANLSGKEALVVRAPRTETPLILLDGSKLEQAWLKADSDKTKASAHRHAQELRVFLEGMLKAMLAGHISAPGDMSVTALREDMIRLAKARRAPWHRSSFAELATKLSSPALHCIHQANHTDRTEVEYADSKKLAQLWPSLSKQLLTCFRELRDWQLVHGSGAPFNLPESTQTFPEGFSHLLKAKKLLLLGRASAFSGRVSEGTLLYEELDSLASNGVSLGKHSAYRLAANTLEPVARPGDILLVQEFGEPRPPSLVVAVAADRLMARRFVLSETASDVAVLTANAIDPYAIAAPLVANVATLKLKPIVGVLFARPDPSGTADPHELVACHSESAITDVLNDCTGLVEVKGQSAQPLALNGQFLLLGREARSLPDLRRLDGRPVIALDSEQHRFFKRLRLAGGDLIILESLDGGGEYPPEVLWHESEDSQNRRTLTAVWAVLGVLFERPGS